MFLKSLAGSLSFLSNDSESVETGKIPRPWAAVKGGVGGTCQLKPRKGSQSVGNDGGWAFVLLRKDNFQGFYRKSKPLGAKLKHFRAICSTDKSIFTRLKPQNSSQCKGKRVTAGASTIKSTHLSRFPNSEQCAGPYFSGLRSLYMMPRLWRWSSPKASSAR